MKTVINYNNNTIIIEGGKVFMNAFNKLRDGYIQVSLPKQTIKYMLRHGAVTTA